jgi:hypothetical protein
MALGSPMAIENGQSKNNEDHSQRFFLSQPEVKAIGNIGEDEDV